jgi:hypothetical protein
VKAGQVGDASRIEDRERIQAGRIKAGADRLAAGCELGRRDLRRLQ